MKDKEELDAEAIFEAIEDLGNPFARWFRPYKKRYPAIDERAMRIQFERGERRELCK